MTNKTWYKYSERKPTEADAVNSRVLRLIRPKVLRTAFWDENYTLGYWRRLDDDDFPPIERKLHPAWQPIQDDSDYTGVWLLSPETGRPWYAPKLEAEAALSLGFTHWQPATKLPPVFEDEQ